MITMKIKINERKIIEEKIYSVSQIYDKIDEILKSKGINRKDNQNQYVGNNDSNDFANFGRAILELKEYDWFRKYIEEWLWNVDGEVEDIAKFYNLKAKIA